MAAHGASAGQSPSSSNRGHRRSSGRVVHLPLYDVRVRRELAHRRFVVSVVRQAGRLVTLHAMDALAVAVAFMVASAVSGVPVNVDALPALIAFLLLGLNVRGSYRAGAARRDLPRLVSGALIGIALTLIPATLPSETGLTSQFLLVFGAIAIAVLVVERLAIDALVHQAYMRGYGLRRALLIARPHETMELMAGLVPGPASGAADDQVVVGHVTPDSVADPSALGTLEEVERIVGEKEVTELLVATPLAPEVLHDLSELCFASGVRFLVIPPAPSNLQGWAELTQVGSWPAYQLHPARLEMPALILKRASDLILASLGVILSLPLMALIAVGIRIESPGPVFFRQRRVGLGGREFMMWKFRSMYHEAEARQHEVAHLNPYGNAPLFKLPRDPRVTRVGRLLRRFSLDELPQLFNILVGDMSLVGPRPPLPSEVKRYESRHYVRLSVVPGLTGPWQVNGRNLITDFEEVVRLEREYIEHWSLRSDLRIILRTLGVVISGKGAY